MLDVLAEGLIYAVVRATRSHSPLRCFMWHLIRHDPYRTIPTESSVSLRVDSSWKMCQTSEPLRIRVFEAETGDFGGK